LINKNGVAALDSTLYFGVGTTSTACHAYPYGLAQIGPRVQNKRRRAAIVSGVAHRPDLGRFAARQLEVKESNLQHADLYPGGSCLSKCGLHARM